MKEQTPGEPRPEHNFLRRVNLIRSVGAHGAFLTGAAMELFMKTPGTTAHELLLGGVALWAIGIPIEREIGEPRKALIRIHHETTTTTRRELE